MHASPSFQPVGHCLTPNPASRGQPRWFGTCQHLSARVSTCQHMCVLDRAYLSRIAPSRCTLCLVAHAVPPPSSQCSHRLPCQLRMSTRRNTDISATGTAHIRRLTMGLQRPERVRDLAYVLVGMNINWPCAARRWRWYVNSDCHTPFGGTAAPHDLLKLTGCGAT